MPQSFHQQGESEFTRALRKVLGFVLLQLVCTEPLFMKPIRLSIKDPVPFIISLWLHRWTAVMMTTLHLMMHDNVKKTLTHLFSSFYASLKKIIFGSRQGYFASTYVQHQGHKFFFNCNTCSNSICVLSDNDLVMICLELARTPRPC